MKSLLYTQCIYQILMSSCILQDEGEIQFYPTSYFAYKHWMWHYVPSLYTKYVLFLLTSKLSHLSVASCKEKMPSGTIKIDSIKALQHFPPLFYHLCHSFSIPCCLGSFPTAHSFCCSLCLSSAVSPAVAVTTQSTYGTRFTGRCEPASDPTITWTSWRLLTPSASHLMAHSSTAALTKLSESSTPSVLGETVRSGPQ